MKHFSCCLFYFFLFIVLVFAEPSELFCQKSSKGKCFCCPVDSGLVIDLFGLRPHPIFKGGLMHYGIDIQTAMGSNVYSIGEGKVIFAGEESGYGNCIKIFHSDGYKSFYAHLDTILVDMNQVINDGEKIGTVGMSGITKTPHLHLEIQKGEERIDPLNVIDTLNLTFQN